MALVHPGRRATLLIFNAVLLILVWALYQPHQGAWRDAPNWGNGSPEIRAAILQHLHAFQDGYTKRDTSQVGPFVSRLFSRESPVVLGTMPGEIYVGHEAVSRLIQTDWESWGDCRFRLENTLVSASGPVAWFATAGSVTFDLSRFLVLPLRLSGVMVDEGGTWKLRQLQFQFDLDLSTLLLLTAVLLAWFVLNSILLLVSVLRGIAHR